MVFVTIRDLDGWKRSFTEKVLPVMHDAFHRKHTRHRCEDDALQLYGRGLAGGNGPLLQLCAAVRRAPSVRALRNLSVVAAAWQQLYSQHHERLRRDFPNATVVRVPASSDVAKRGAANVHAIAAALGVPRRCVSDAQATTWSQPLNAARGPMKQRQGHFGLQPETHPPVAATVVGPEHSSTRYA